jgi:hypothetical protein
VHGGFVQFEQVPGDNISTSKKHAELVLSIIRTIIFCADAEPIFNVNNLSDPYFAEVGVTENPVDNTCKVYPSKLPTPVGFNLSNYIIFNNQDFIHKYLLFGVS